MLRLGPVTPEASVAGRGGGACGTTVPSGRKNTHRAPGPALPLAAKEIVFTLELAALVVTAPDETDGVVRAGHRRRGPDGRVAGAPAGVQRATKRQPGDGADNGDECDHEKPDDLGQVADQGVVAGDDVEDAIDPHPEHDESEQPRAEQAELEP